MPPAVSVEKDKEDLVKSDGKILERSQEDGELYSKPTIGIIYPPPEVRNIVDRTANFVARNGPEFEVRIRGNEADNPKFNFLNPNDPYYAYYEHKLKEFREIDTSEPVAILPVTKEAPKIGQQLKQKIQQQVVETIVPKDPPPVFEYMSNPPTISAIDLDIVKLTAQFVAKNGKAFLTNLMTREQRNYQFDFLRPQHSLFQYFTRLVEQYTKILLPPGDISERLEKDIVDPWKVLERIQYRVEWQKYQEREKRKEEDEKERERIAFAQIDWHDFVVVETVNFREQEVSNLPPPVTRDQLGARILAQERLEKEQGGDEELPNEQMEMDVEDEEEEELYQPFVQDMEDANKSIAEEKEGSDMEEESDEEDKDEAQKHELPQKVPPAPGVNATVRRNYDPKAKVPPQSNTVNDKFLISPLTGEKVSVESMQQHMKISLLDPRWKEQKEKAIEEKRQQERVYAEGVHIGDTLKQLAERRSDIFGVGAEETLIGRKLGEEEDQSKQTKEIWDGHTASMERATKLAHSNITFEDQIKAIHRSKGLLPSEDAERIGPSVPQAKIIPEHKTAKESSTPPLPPQLPSKQATKIISSSEKTITIDPLVPQLQPTQTQPSVVSNNLPPVSNNPPPNPPPGLLPPPFMGARPGAPSIPRPPGPPPNMGMVRPPLMPPGMMMPPQSMGQPTPRFMPPAMPPPSEQDTPVILPPPMEEEEPASKKAKMDSLEADLVPENLFLETNRLPVTFRVQVPELPDKPEWQCQGQVLTITLPLHDQCSVIKAKIFDMIDMPAGKQKLQLGNFFIKDSNSLAYYNFNSSSLIQLQLKERGGRKK